MRISKEELQEYCMMFPIAYYAGKPLPLEAEYVDTSCANIVNGSIYISVSQINDKISKLGRIDPATIRPLVYHEVSHVILTPQCWANAISRVTWQSDAGKKLRDLQSKEGVETNITTIVNLFEDERIETIMQNTYMDVNFYANICAINDWMQAQIPSSPYSAFYEMLRMHDIKSKGFAWRKHYAKSRQLILKWQLLQPNSDIEIVKQYFEDILNLYYDFVTELLDSDEMMRLIASVQKLKRLIGNVRSSSQKAESETPVIHVGPACNDIKDDDDDEDDEDEDDDVKEDSKAKDDNNNANDYHYESHTPMDYQAPKADEKDDKKDEKDEIEEASSIEELEDLCDDDEEDEGDDFFKSAYTGSPVSMNVEQTRRTFEKYVLDVQDENVKALLTQKFFIKDMHGAQMSAIHKHSGKLDIKAIGRNDWKIFKQPSVFSDGSKIGKKLHLIIVLDQSGSYSGNDKATNMILASLVKAEERIKAFEFTIFKFGSGFRVCGKKDRYSSSHEATEFSVAMFNKLNSLKRQDSANFIIFLNDGAAWICGDDRRSVVNAMRRTLDHSNCVCILDYDAYAAWFKQMKNAKIIVTDKYVQQLSNNVCEALSAMLAV